MKVERNSIGKGKIGKQSILIAVIFSLMINLVLPFANDNSAAAAEKKYTMIIADKNGKYTYYDLNDSTSGKAHIETTSAGNVMIPLWTVSKLLGLSYRYDSKAKTATLTNSSNGKKVVFTKGSKTYLYYSSKTAKAVKKTMPYQMYISKASNSVMVHMSGVKWVFKTTSGCKYVTAADMQKNGYDTYTYKGLLIYNPYGSIGTIPKATAVNGIAKTVRVTIPEGYSAAQIFDLLVKKGVCATTASLYDAMKNYDFSYYPLVSEIEANDQRCFKLEGYLYPDTYEFNRLSKPQDAIGKFLRNSEAKITKADRDKAAAMGYTVDEILTVASMIEKETANADERPLVASVIYNRLNLSMKLQFDSTIFYVERYIKPYISGDVNRYNSFYNTYKCAALPAGPICNPGKAAIQAALNPSDTEYLYFYSDDKGIYYFSKDYVNPNAVTQQ